MAAQGMGKRCIGCVYRLNGWRTHEEKEPFFLWLRRVLCLAILETVVNAVPGKGAFIEPRVKATRHWLGNHLASEATPSLQWDAEVGL